MDKKIIVHGLIFGVVFGLVHHFIGENPLNETLMLAGALTFLAVLTEWLMAKVRTKKPAQKPAMAKSHQVAAFVQALGGNTNVAAVDHESSRVKVTLKDVDAIDSEALKALALEGAFLSGDQLQVTFGNEAESVAQQMRENLT